MKRITPSTTNGGAPINLDDFKGVFNLEIWDGILGLLYGFNGDTEGVVVSGCVVSGSGPYNLSAGIVYLNGEMMRLPATNGITLSGTTCIKPDTQVNESRTFEDSSSQILFATQSAIVSSSLPGAGQYIAFTTTTDLENRRLKMFVGPTESVTTNDIAASAVTPAKLDRDYIEHNSLGTGVIDADDFTLGSIQWVNSGSSNIPSASNFIIITGGAGTTSRHQVAIQTSSGGNQSAMYTRRLNLGTWSSWIINNV